MLCLPLPLDWGCLEVLRTALTHPHGHPHPKTGLLPWSLTCLQKEASCLVLISDHILHAETESSRRRQRGKKNRAPRRPSPRARCRGEAEVKAQVETQVHPTCLQTASLGRASAMALGVSGVTNSEGPRVQARSGPWFFWMDHSLLHTQEVPSEIPPQEVIVHWGRHCPGGDQHGALEGRKLGLDSC